MPKQSEIAYFITSLIAKETGLKENDISADGSFFEYGLDSISAIFLLEQVCERYNIELSPLYFWDYPTIDAFSNQIYKENFAP
ncbi:MAG: acyl carrier protein [Fulvivirga sp.]